MLNVSPINFARINNNFKKEQTTINQGLTQDIFVKSTSFKGKSVEKKGSFSQWAEETDFIKSKLGEVLLNDEHKIGAGFSNTAYNIPGNDDYVLRMPTRGIKRIYIPNIEKALIKEFDSNIDINIGQKVAEIIIPSQWAKEGQEDWSKTVVEVLRKQTGEAVGVQPPETLVYSTDFSTEFKADELPYEDITRKKKYERTIDKLANLPIESYETLISEFTKAIEAGYSFDHLNSNNILVDGKRERINLIDMGYSEPHKKGTPDYANLLYSLTNISYYSTFLSDYNNEEISQEQKNKATKNTIEIISKFMQAMKNQGVKFADDNFSSEVVYTFLPSFPCAMYCRSGDSNAFVKKAKEMGIM